MTTAAPHRRRAVTALPPGAVGTWHRAAQMRGLDVCLEDALQIICSERLVDVTLLPAPAPPAAEGGSVWLGWYKEQHKPSGHRGTQHSAGLEDFWGKSH